MIEPVSHARVGRVQDPYAAFELESREFGAELRVDGLEGVSAPSFGDTLADALKEVSAAHEHADALAFDFATGKPVDVHTMMIAAAKADVLMQMTSAVVSKTATGLNQLLQTQI